MATIGVKLAIIIGVGLFGVGLLIGAVLKPPIYEPPPSPSSGNENVILQASGDGPCPWKDAPLAGVEDPSRLTVMEACATVKGVVQEIVLKVNDERTAYHFTILPDAGYAQFVNGENTAQLKGALVVEVLPADSTIMPRLALGQHLEVQGPHVTDTVHGWNEIHPAKVITQLE